MGLRYMCISVVALVDGTRWMGLRYMCISVVALG